MKRMMIMIVCLVLMAPIYAAAHRGELDELGGHFRNSDCTYLLHEPTALAKQAKTKEELVQLIQKYNGNERCKRNLTPDRIDLDGHALGGKEGDASLRLGQTYKAALVGCVDGDTAKFRVNGHVYTTRFLFIDTPESTIEVEPYGKEASQFTCSRLQKGDIVLETDGNTLFDKYQRLLAWVWVDGRLLQEEIAKAGLVEDFYDYGDYKYEDRVRAALNEAKRTGTGMYGRGAADEKPTPNGADHPPDGNTPSNEKSAGSPAADQPSASDQEAAPKDRAGHPVVYALLGLLAAAALYWFVRRGT
ncbi:thermonuclease family protein [Geobacillus stearothermophilus]|uniref:thermonuclease family protein n=1 Tax=Geobacillus stearothermophilus TaxID=1422 RepID=UPI002E204E5E|nr:thermonuclease family protein [Geobacillus stearothermophilus]MED3749041.1 thermonuclease family protein [Geobacillus stearothermophilus]MED3754319.1 thermonuclease family protein [Geobacillus stearothermophilus]MED3769934.1 thermonuclease family protein [Geobacillus stearothermophilus]MED3771993.1 thermonuclease family protein [Geobacillus stearothermophilus]